MSREYYYKVPKAWIPLRWKIFPWLVIRTKCRTADHFAKHGLPHNAQCGLCHFVKQGTKIFFFLNGVRVQKDPELLLIDAYPVTTYSRTQRN